MRTSHVAILIVTILFTLQFIPVAHGEQMYTTRMVPENPVEGDTITIYYENPNATQVSIIVQSEDGGTAIKNSGHGKDGNAWWFRFSDMPAGDFVYKVNARPINDSIPNDDNFHVLVHFHVEKGTGGLKGDDGNLTQILIFLLIVGTVSIGGAYLYERRR